ncbi:hypothetical protein ACSHFV_004498 [Escherichia coli]
MSTHEGLTVNGANKAKEYGKVFNNMFPSYGLYSTDTLRTVQTATFFQVAKLRLSRRCQLVMMMQ